ncbi:hypothetical protein [Nocardia shimofusensis]|uniref:hypothetical protein n=1 Tax=Nocardia shimofusensis TaxID=228596 RepID=UPI00082C810F|nr:hypothetical protein [Nocardia shimofusensis]
MELLHNAGFVVWILGNVGILVSRWRERRRSLHGSRFTVASLLVAALGAGIAGATYLAVAEDSSWPRIAVAGALLLVTALNLIAALSRRRGAAR